MVDRPTACAVRRLSQPSSSSASARSSSGPLELVTESLDPVAVVVGVAFGDEVDDAGREAFEAELAQRLQQPVAATGGAVLDDHHGLLDEALQPLDGREGVEAASSRTPPGPRRGRTSR